jgi:hypothetical protein
MTGMTLAGKLSKLETQIQSVINIKAKQAHARFFYVGTGKP